MNAVALACAYALDLAAGDPLKAGSGSARRDFVSGVALCASIVVLTAAAAAAFLVGARRIHPSVGFMVEGLLAWTVLATGSLLAEARQVLKAVDRHDLTRNFLLLRLPAAAPGSEQLRAQLIASYGLIVRDCRSFDGLSNDRFIRVAVRGATRTSGSSRRCDRSLTRDKEPVPREQ